MVAMKNRYMVMEMFFEGEGPSLSHAVILNAIKESILLNFGELGLGTAVNTLQVKYLNPVTKLCVIRCSRSEYEKIWCAITFITNINKCPAFFNLLDLTGNTRCCRRAALAYDKAKLAILKNRTGKNKLTSKQLDLANSCLEKIPEIVA